MQAAIYTRYGPPDVVQVLEVPRPAPKDNEVLIRVRAASLNPLDYTWMRGKPYPIRLMGGLRAPKDTRLGADVAGVVEAVGGMVTRFKPGDAVYGICRGSLAEYVCVSESAGMLSALAIKPQNLTFEQAAAAPVAAITALQALRDKGHIQPGHQVLVNGAAGGVGTFAVQIAHAFGAVVTGVCSTRNLDLVRSLGANTVIDYTQQDFTNGGQRYDILFDCIGNHSFSECRRVLKPNGKLLGVGAPHTGWFGPIDRLLLGFVLSWFTPRMVPFIAKAGPDDLMALHGLFKAGKITPVIDKCYRLTQVSEAIGHLEAGHARGKVVISVE